MSEGHTNHGKARGLSLHIGVNRVDPAFYGGEWDGALKSCENDADTMQAIAGSRGFETSQIKTSAATRDGVIQSIRDVARELRPGDIFLLTYAGHGGQLKDLSGDEADRMDDTWILYDGHFLDDEMNVLFSEFKPGCRILMISDSCHSGTLLKGAAEDDQVERVEDDFTHARLIPRTAAKATEKEHIGFYARIQRDLPRPHPEIRASVRLLSGCQESERSWGNDDTGRFTAALKTTYGGGEFQGDYSQFHRQIVKALEKAMNPQTPGYMVAGASNEEFDRQPPFVI